LNRLEEKGYVRSQLGGATKERGGRRKRLFTISAAGKKALIRTKEQRDELWSMIPGTLLKNI
jgi:DNA-binding PadR family transcriptional regulator